MDPGCRGQKSGSLTLWNLAANGGSSNTPFTVGSDWTLVTNMIDLANFDTDQITYRVEFYMTSTGPHLLVDCANIF